MSTMTYQKQILDAFWNPASSVNLALYWIAMELASHGTVKENSKLMLMLPLSNFALDMKLKLELQIL